MKCLYIFNTSARGVAYGIGTYTEQLVECTQGADIRVSIVELCSPVKEFEMKEQNNIRYIRIPKPIYFVGNDYQKESAMVQRVAVYMLKDYVSDEDDNVFHLNRMEFLPLACMLKKICKGKIVMTVHYTNWSFALLGDKKRLHEIISASPDKLTFKDYKIYNAIVDETRLVNSYCDKVIAISQHTYDDIISVYGVNPDRVVLINNALCDRYRTVSKMQKRKLRQKYHIVDDEILLIFAGRLDEIKGIYILMEAFNKIVERNSRCRLIVAGSGVYDEVFKHSRYANSRITFMGFVPKNVMHQLYSIADIGVVPSIHEEFGYVAVEMMMHRLPIIVSNTTGLAEIVQDGITGILVRVNRNKSRMRQSVHDWVDKIEILLNDPLLREKYGKAGRKRYIQRYALPVFQKRMMRLYESVLNGFSG